MGINDIKLFDNVALYLFFLLMLGWVASCSFGKYWVGLLKMRVGSSKLTHIHLRTTISYYVVPVQLNPSP